MRGPDILRDQTVVLGQLLDHNHVTAVTQPQNPRVCIPLGVQPAQKEVFRPNAQRYKDGVEIG